MPGVFGFKQCAGCGTAIPKADEHESCIRCLGFQHPVPKCSVCTSLKKRSLHNRFQSMLKLWSKVPEETREYFHEKGIFLGYSPSLKPGAASDALAGGSGRKSLSVPRCPASAAPGTLSGADPSLGRSKPLRRKTTPYVPDDLFRPDPVSVPRLVIRRQGGVTGVAAAVSTLIPAVELASAAPSVPRYRSGPPQLDKHPKSDLRAERGATGTAERDVSPPKTGAPVRGARSLDRDSVSSSNLLKNKKKSDKHKSHSPVPANALTHRYRKKKSHTRFSIRNFILSSDSEAPKSPSVPEPTRDSVPVENSPVPELTLQAPDAQSPQSHGSPGVFDRFAVEGGVPDNFLVETQPSPVPVIDPGQEIEWRSFLSSSHSSRHNTPSVASRTLSWQAPSPLASPTRSPEPRPAPQVFFNFIQFPPQPGSSVVLQPPVPTPFSLEEKKGGVSQVTTVESAIQTDMDPLEGPSQGQTAPSEQHILHSMKTMMQEMFQQFIASQEKPPSIPPSRKRLREEEDSSSDNAEQEDESLSLNKRFFLLVEEAMSHLQIPSPSVPVQHSGIFSGVSPSVPKTHVPMDSTLLTDMKSVWQKPHSLPPVSRSVENRYKTHPDEPVMFLSHPPASSIVVSAASQKGKSPAISAPPDKDAKSLDAQGKKVYCLGSLTIRQMNTAALLAKYSSALWEEVSNRGDFLADSEPKEDIMFFTEQGRETATQLLLLSREAADSAARCMANGIDMRRQAWLRCSSLQPEIQEKILDLPFDGLSLFHPSTDEVLQQYKTGSLTAKSLSAISVPPAPKPGPPSFRSSTAFQKFKQRQNQKPRPSKKKYRKGRQPSFGGDTKSSQ